MHPNLHAMLADPMLVNTATETLRALHAHGLRPVLVQELTEPTLYGPDGDEGNGCDANLEEKQMWQRRSRIEVDRIFPRLHESQGKLRN